MVVIVPGDARVPSVVTTVVVMLPTVVVTELAAVAVVAVADVDVVVVPLEVPNLLINWLVASWAMRSPVMRVPAGNAANLAKLTVTGDPLLSTSTVKALSVKRPASLASPLGKPATQS